MVTNNCGCDVGGKKGPLDSTSCCSRRVGDLQGGYLCTFPELLGVLCLSNLESTMFSESTMFFSRAKHFAKGKAQNSHLQLHTSWIQGKFHPSECLHQIHSCTREVLLQCQHELKVLSWWWQGRTLQLLSLR